MRVSKRQAITTITSAVLSSARKFLIEEGFVELLPVILAPLTDPLRSTPEQATVKAYGREWHLTRSMIFHKQATIGLHERVFVCSPNVRLEGEERASSGRHLFEFSQLDLEVRGADRAWVMDLGERLLCWVAAEVAQQCSRALAELNRDLSVPRRPFPTVSYLEACAQWGPDFEESLSRACRQPVWVVDFPKGVREFYDREDPARPGILLDMDLLYPEGFGEALSGGEREHLPERISRRIEEQGLAPSAYRGLRRLAERGIPPSAGFGIGIERLVRFLAGLKHVGAVSPFPRVPGAHCDL